ncbi:MAG: outer membrane protein assembly factor, partial [Candidatus Omnitrophica bacterium]|nr:outer membrane protein assembly factor [Candidatus Omnitrophota bacterium]
VYHRKHEQETDVGYPYNEKITGGDIRLGRELTEYVRVDSMYRYDIVEISDVVPEASADLKREVGKNRISSLQLGLSFDSRDNIFDPRRGNYLSGSMEVAGGPFGGDKDFWKFFGRASHYFGLLRNSTLELRLRSGFADTYKDTQKIPIYERFFVGGAYTVRGYHERKLGPIDSVSEEPLGGNVFLVGNIEYLYPIFDFLKFALFYDTGYAWPKIRDVEFRDLCSSFGFGVRLKTPLGPFLLDYGIPLDKEPGEKDKGKGRFHFSMSHGF